MKITMALMAKTTPSAIYGNDGIVRSEPASDLSPGVLDPEEDVETVTLVDEELDPRTWSVTVSRSE